MRGMDRSSVSFTVIRIKTVPSRLGHANGASDQRALDTGSFWMCTSGRSCTGSSAPPAEIDAAEN